MLETQRCEGGRTPVSLRPLLICSNCDRRHSNGTDMAAPSYHDGTQWMCDARLVDGVSAPVMVIPSHEE